MRPGHTVLDQVARRHTVMRTLIVHENQYCVQHNLFFTFRRGFVLIHGVFG